jgi:uncharacterized protein involved in outer membrane biogenesis
MRKFLVALSGLIAFLFIVFVAVVAYVLTFDPNENKDWIAAKFAEASGRELTLGGEIGLTIYPWLGITANEVSIGNAPGFSATPLLQAEHMEVRIKLMPLLNDAYEIDTVRLYGARVNLEVLGDGTNNWTLAGADAATEQGSEGAGALPANLIIGGVDIRNTSIVYDDQFANTHYEVSNLNATVGELVYGAPLNIRMTLDAASRTPQLTAALNIGGTVVYDVDNGRYDLDPLTLTATLRGPTVPAGAADLRLSTALGVNLDDDTLSLRNLEFDALDTHLNAGIEISRVRTGTPAFTGTLNLVGSDLAVLFRIIGQDALAQRISSLNSAFDINASIDADLRTGAVKVPSLQASLLGADIDGTLTASRINTETPAFNGNLTAAGPDLPTLIEVAGMLQGGSDSALSQFGRDLAGVPDKTFRVQSAFTLDMQSGALEVPELYAGLLGATINGDVSGSRINTDTPQLRGRLNAQGPDLPLLMQIAGQLQGGREAALNQYGRQLRAGVRNRAFTLSTDFDADLERGNIQLPTLTAALLGFRLNGTLDARNMQGNDGSIAGALNLEGENLGEVLAALGQQGLADVAQSLRLNLAVNGSGNELRISPLALAVVLSGAQIPNSPQTLALNADTIINRGNDSLRVDDFTLSGLGLNLGGNVSAQNLSGDVSYAGQFDLPAFNARSLLQQLNQDVPRTADSNALTSVALSSAFNGTANSLALDNLALKLDDSMLTGSLAVNDFTTQAARFTLNVDRIDADRYIAPPMENTAASTEASPLPVEQLRALDVQGALNIGQLTIYGLNMSSIVVEVKAANGSVVLDPVRAALYDGTFAGTVGLDANAAQPTATVNTTLTSIDLEPLLRDFMDATYLTGTGNIQLALSGSGADTMTIKRNLNGNGSLRLENGVLTGVDVADVLGRIETMIRERRLVELPQGGATPFEDFAATLAVNQGVVSSNDLRVVAPGWELTGSGTLVNLANDSIDFDLVTRVVPETVPAGQQYNLSGNTLPIACSGTLSNPRCLPDAQQIITAALAGAVQRRLGDFLQERLGTPQQQTLPGTEPAPAESTPETEPAETEEAVDPAEELFERALDRLLR